MLLSKSTHIAKLLDVLWFVVHITDSGNAKPQRLLDCLLIAVQTMNMRIDETWCERVARTFDLLQTCLLHRRSTTTNFSDRAVLHKHVATFDERVSGEDEDILKEYVVFHREVGFIVSFKWQAGIDQGIIDSLVRYRTIYSYSNGAADENERTSTAHTSVAKYVLKNTGAVFDRIGLG
jgi:hypothetical protein